MRLIRLFKNIQSGLCLIFSFHAMKLNEMFTELSLFHTLCFYFLFSFHRNSFNFPPEFIYSKIVNLQFPSCTKPLKITFNIYVAYFPI